MDKEVTLTLSFRVIDPLKLDIAADYSDEDPITTYDKIEQVIANLDVIALARGKSQGWNDLGLERIDA